MSFSRSSTYVIPEISHDDDLTMVTLADNIAVVATEVDIKEVTNFQMPSVG